MDDSLEGIILQNISKPVAFFDSEGNLIISNKEWDSFCGAYKEGLGDIFTYEDFLAAAKLKPLEDNLMYSSVKTICCCNKTIIVKRRKIFTTDYCGVLVEIEDISGLEERTLNMKKIITDSMWKIRSGISNVQNVTTLLLDYPSCRLNEECRGLLIDTNIELWKLSRHIEKLRLLCLTTTDNENFPVKYEKINTKKFIEEIIQYFEPLIRSFSEKPEIKVSIDEDFSFYSDYYICFMAVSAVLYNALIYNKGKIAVNIEAHKKEDKTSISVMDNGIGIKDKELEKIFSYGFSGDKKEDYLSKGAGTELFLVRKLLNFINSEISFISKENEGSKFNIIIKDAG
ncbi:MAG: HAMP domain-containing histidine kinase [Chitinispirillaceae bacterium]|nr:HAMP domain-containing histidine kinase [Chitinispirillaceae bacterium]